MTSRKITATWTRKTIVDHRCAPAAPPPPGSATVECTVSFSQSAIAINYVYSRFGYHTFNPQLLFIASTHALVHFLSDDTIVIVPLKRVTQVDNEVLKEGVNCLVKWTDGVQYEATVKAIGKQQTFAKQPRAYIFVCIKM